MPDYNDIRLQDQELYCALSNLFSISFQNTIAKYHRYGSRDYVAGQRVISNSYMMIDLSELARLTRPSR